jgi:hypothetical protein
MGPAWRIPIAAICQRINSLRRITMQDRRRASAGENKHSVYAIAIWISRYRIAPAFSMGSPRRAARQYRGAGSIHREIRRIVPRRGQMA